MYKWLAWRTLVQFWKTPLKSDAFRRRAVDSVHIVQSGRSMACWIAKGLNCVAAKIQVSPRTYAFATPTQSLENSIYTIWAPFWEPIWCSKCSEKNFLQPTHIEITHDESSAYAKYKKPSKTGLGTILKTHFSINQNFEQNYILCRNFRLIRLGGGVLRLREVFPYGTRINTKIMNHIAAQLIHKSPIKLFYIIEKI